MTTKDESMGFVATLEGGGVNVEVEIIVTGTVTVVVVTETAGQSLESPRARGFPRTNVESARAAAAIV